MKESALWRQIAAKIVNAGTVERGLCVELDDLARQLVEDDMKWAQMEDRISSYMEPEGGYVYPEGTEVEARALAALWLALEAEEEGD